MILLLATANKCVLGDVLRSCPSRVLTFNDGQGPEGQPGFLCPPGHGSTHPLSPSRHSRSVIPAAARHAEHSHIYVMSSLWPRLTLSAPCSLDPLLPLCLSPSLLPGTALSLDSTHTCTEHPLLLTQHPPPCQETKSFPACPSDLCTGGISTDLFMAIV